MRAILLVAVAALVISCKREVPCSEPAPARPAARADFAPASAAGGANPAPAPAPSSTAPPGGVVPNVRVAYVEPEDPSHRPCYEELRARHVLEQAAEAIASIPLPKQLLLQFKGCDGDSNAYYDEETATVTFCYEYLSEIRQMAVQHLVDGKYVQFPGSDDRIPFMEAIEGPVAFVLFHEMGHAIYHLRRVPVLGRQEDAADYFAAAALLRLGKEKMMCHLRGAAWAYAVGAMKMAPDLTDFADSHSLDSQRYFNILCLAYGSDPAHFAPIVKRAKLPQDRVDDCIWEYRQVRYALDKLVMPSGDVAHLDDVQITHSARYDYSPSRGRRAPPREHPEPGGGR